MNVDVACPSCGKTAKVASEHIGRKARCSQCGTDFVLTARNHDSNANPNQAKPPSQDASVVMAEISDEHGPVHVVRGMQDVLEVYPDKVAITPQGVLGFFNKGKKGRKEIPFASIVAVEFKEAGHLLSGYLQFTIPGGNESSGGILAATQDENTFMFSHVKNNEQVRRIKEFIDQGIRNSRAPTSSRTNRSLPDELQALARLHSEGVLNDEEFQAAKRKLIGGI